MTSEPQKLRVAIIGGGIGGLTLAVALRKLCQSRVQIDIYEAAPAFTEIGAGIGVSPRVWEILETLGLAHDLSAISYRIREDGKEGQVIEFRRSDCVAHDGVPEAPSHCYIKTTRIRPFHRAEFQATLSAHLLPDPSYSAHFNKRVLSYTVSPDDPEAVVLAFADGSNAVCDLLVGCDGIRSAVRSTLYRSLPTPADPVWSGSVAYRCLIPRDVLVRVDPEHPSLSKAMLATGQSKHVVAFPIANGKLVNIVAFVTKPEAEGTKYEGKWTREASKEEIVDAYAGWEPRVTQLIGCIDKASLWAINTIPQLPTYVGESVALLGDAAHAMTPHQGSGAGQAIEDAFILASLLAHPRATRQTLPRVLEVYDSIRRPFSQDIAERSRACGMLYDHLLAPSEVGVGEAGNPQADDLEKRSEAVEQLLLWASETSLMGDRDKALRELDALLGAGTD